MKKWAMKTKTTGLLVGAKQYCMVWNHKKFPVTWYYEDGFYHLALLWDTKVLHLFLVVSQIRFILVQQFHFLYTCSPLPYCHVCQFVQRFLGY